MGFARAPFVFLVKQTGAESTGCGALETEAFEGVGREIVFSWLAPKSRRWSGPICSYIRLHRASRIAKAPAQGLPVVN